MSVIKMRGCGEGDKKLASVRPGSCIGHGKHAFTIMPQRGMELVSEAVSRATGPCSEGASTLNDESLNDTVEGQAIVEVSALFGLLASFGQIDKVPYRLRAFFGVEFYLELAVIGIENRDRSIEFFRVVDFGCHEFSSLKVDLLEDESSLSKKECPIVI
jgi:hypothetical protein